MLSALEQRDGRGVARDSAGGWDRVRVSRLWDQPQPVSLAIRLVLGAPLDAASAGIAVPAMSPAAISTAATPLAMMERLI